MSAHRWLALASVIASCFVCSADACAQAQADGAKRYFDAGAAAYTAGDYQAAVQALEAAYRLQPLPAIAFSLAQALRRQYFVSQDLGQLQRAIALYRAYLTEVPTGGRRADATDALGQLEPIALARAGEAATDASEHQPTVLQTRLMVRCLAPQARIALDGGAFVEAPLIAETEPGPHRVRAEAPGYFPVEQAVTAIEGELVPIEIALTERPALIEVGDRDGAEVYVDGLRATSKMEREGLSLRAGAHRVAFAKKGHRLDVVAVDVSAGKTVRLTPDLRWTDQRIAAVTLFAVGGAGLVAGGVFTGLALHHESTAHDIDDKRMNTTLTPAERDEYAEAVAARDGARLAAISGFAIGAGALLTGLLLYYLDDPNPQEAAPRTRVQLDVQVQRDGGAAARLGVQGSWSHL